jgi:adiponectin receptor
MAWSSLKAIHQHRPHSTSYIACVKSIWQLHNETINIWTHLIASVVFCTVSVCISSRRQRKRTDEACVNSLYFQAAACIFVCSTFCHTFENHKDAAFWRCLDHCSITAFIWASSYSFTRLTYSSERPAPRLYTAILTSVALGLVLRNLYSFTAWNQLRGANHVSHAVYGAFAALPAFLRPFSFHWRTSRAHKRLLEKFQALIVISTMGAGLYTTRLLDTMIGASGDWGQVGQVGHHAMHITTVIGACIYGRELLRDCPA